ncbi:MAG TPA: hypothetical protein VNX68_14925, partial [Nitrosopumilaceae archaeon]|nr:hypothetical protein [Nitrosopumilaceae archaeon]
MLFDLMLNPDISNKLSLIILSIIGTIGCYKLLKYLQIGKDVSFICSLIFINSSWFGLHYAEGHIAFGAFQLIALAFYFILRLREARYMVLFALLNAFFLLDGAIYMFIFISLLLFTSLCLSINGVSFKSLFISWRKEWKAFLLSFILFLLLASPKIIPLLLIHADRPPILENYCMDTKFIFNCLFNPFQYKDKPCGYNICFFHEFGCYIGIVAFSLFACFIVLKKHFLRFYKYIILAVLFFWIGSGTIEVINPYRIIQHIPLANNAHIQSRYFIISILAFIILLANSLDWIKSKISP